MKDGKFVTLGIESSCDETAAAVLLDARELKSNIIASQIDVHKVFGGVVPEIASRHHLEQVNSVVDQALVEAGISYEEIDLIGITKGPGLVGALLIGIATAKSLAFALNKPFVGIHHIKAHSLAALIEYPELKPPYLSLVVSGGHTDLIDVRDYSDFVILGRTRDDAIGEAYDKVARVLGLGYPGGPKIDRIAREGNPHAVEFKRVYLDKGSFDFSFSGTKTGVLNYINSEKQKGNEINPADVAASFQLSVIDVVVDKAIAAAKQFKHRKIVMGGGVASNTMLREKLHQACVQEGLELYYPPSILCTDNAAMVACCAYYDYQSGKQDGLDMDAYANLPL
jgi:N6-L-threonylcarbamoyladenine synthase